MGAHKVTVSSGEPYAVGPFDLGTAAPTTKLAENVVIDREKGTFTVDGYPIESRIAAEIGEITKVTDDGPTALFRIPITLVGRSIAANAVGVLVVDDCLFPWDISGAGPSIEYRDRTFLVTVELIAERVEEIGTEAQEVGTDGR